MVTPEDAAETEILGGDKPYMASVLQKTFLFYGSALLLPLYIYAVPPILENFWGATGLVGGYLSTILIIIALVYGLWSRYETAWTIIKENQLKVVYYMGVYAESLFDSRDKILMGDEVVDIVNLTYEELKFLEGSGRITMHPCKGTTTGLCEAMLLGTIRWEGLVPVKDKNKEDKDKDRDKDKAGNEIHDKDKDKDKEDKDKENQNQVFFIKVTRSLKRRIFGGLRFIGPYPFYQIKTFILPKHVQIVGTQEVLHPKEHIHSITVSEIVYGVPLKEVVDKNLWPIVGDLAIYGTVRNMRKAFVDSVDGLVQGHGTVHSEFSHYARGFPYKDINQFVIRIGQRQAPDKVLGDKDEIGSAFWIWMEANGTLKEILNRYGFDISAVKAVKPFVSPKYESKVLEISFAEIDGQAAAAKAKGEKDAMIIKAEGEKEAAILRAEGIKASATLAYGDTAKDIFETLKPFANGNPKEEQKLQNWILDVVRRNPYITTKQAYDLWVNGGSSAGSDSNIAGMAFTGTLAAIQATKTMERAGPTTTQSESLAGQPSQSTKSKNPPQDDGNNGGTLTIKDIIDGKRPNF